MLASFEDACLGAWESPGAWAESIANQMLVVQDSEHADAEQLSDYLEIDYEAIVQRLWLDGRIYIARRDGGGVWIFDAAL
ncbi:antirestriction protein ArdA [Luteipulveratus mongoliensis]|uniref:Uncharacterized protein n=1 Tax=Luteipulveratus mongoliensis TaxID=571913 RepID=A0A0K1JN97_9MICO|nr:antirestriction protein ArdA [Luteipulveratus mongoliensis]AKU18189.1 hypothetical protein VV02_23960 [Luteipulveratus mongoliensis]